jgi:hypothetical protein
MLFLLFNNPKNEPISWLCVRAQHCRQTAPAHTNCGFHVHVTGIEQFVTQSLALEKYFYFYLFWIVGIDIFLFKWQCLDLH